MFTPTPTPRRPDTGRAAPAQAGHRDRQLHRLTHWASVIALALAATSTAGVALAQGHAHEPGHDAPAKLTLDHGKKWTTDAALRTHMSQVRAAVAPAVEAAHAGTLGATDYAALAGKVEGAIGGIVAECKLEPKADAMLHLVIGEMVNGADAMKGQAAGVKPEQGLRRVATALNDYARTFDHRGFKPIALHH